MEAEVGEFVIRLKKPSGGELAIDMDYRDRNTERYIDANPFGFKRKTSVPEWIWIRGNSRIEFDDEMVGLFVYFSNCDEKTKRDFLGYLMVHLKQINTEEIHIVSLGKGIDGLTDPP